MRMTTAGIIACKIGCVANSSKHIDVQYSGSALSWDLQWRSLQKQSLEVSAITRGRCHWSKGKHK